MLYLLALIAPPLALLFAGKWGQFIVSAVLCLFVILGLIFFFVPGIVFWVITIVHAMAVIHGKRADERTAKVVEAISQTKGTGAILALLLCLPLWGCAMQGGREFDASYVQQIQKGRTTKAEVREHLGEPVSTTTAGNGEEVWQYAYQKGPNHFQSVVGVYTGKVPMKSQSLTITFAGNVVKEYSFSASK